MQKEFDNQRGEETTTRSPRHFFTIMLSDLLSSTHDDDEARMKSKTKEIVSKSGSSRREAQLEDKRELSLRIRDRDVITKNESFNGIRQVFECNQTRGRSLRLRLEHLDSLRRRSHIFSEDAVNVFLGHAVWSIEEVQYFGWRRYSVLSSSFWVREAIVSISHEVLEGGTSIGKFEGLLDIVQEGLLRVSQLQFLAEEEQVVQRLDTLLDGSRISHLNHSTSCLTLEKLDSDDVAVETKQVE